MIVDRKYTLFPEPEPGKEGYHLNPLQELIFPHKEHLDNVLIIGRTSSGKSTTVPMLGTADLEEGKRILYTAPFKAIVEEQHDNWCEDGCPWKDIPKTIISGDYQYDEAKIEQINKAKLITITPESLLSVVRNQTNDRAKFLPEVGTIFVDEGHLVGESGRGSALETALIELFIDFPNIRLVVMSGTIINYQEYLEWMTRLNGAKTHLVQSNYRPVEVNLHFIPYRNGRTAATEAEKRRKIEELLIRPDKRNQQFLATVFRKSFGQDMLAATQSLGIPTAFHNADIKNPEDRKRIEASFKRGSTRVLWCTTTLSTGVNLPARNGIITDVVWGAGEDVPVPTLQQIIGRVGRPKYDTEGDCYIFVPEKDFDYHVKRIETGEPVISTMRKKDVVAAHFLGAIYLNRFQYLSDFSKWYHRTLAYVQGQMSEASVEILLKGIVDDMKLRGFIKVDDTTGKIELKQRGIICSQMMLDPYRFGNLLANFSAYYALRNPNDVDIARAVGRIGAFYSKWMSEDQKRAIPEPIRKSMIEKEHQLHCSAIYYSLQGRDSRSMPGALSKVWWEVREDLDRYGAALVRACVESEKWMTSEFDSKTGSKVTVSADDNLRLIFLRIRRSLSWEGARKSLEGFTSSEIRALNRVGIYDKADAMKNSDVVSQVIKPHRMASLGLK